MSKDDKEAPNDAAPAAKDEPRFGPAHRWSGWPGAHCLDCGCEHALENAIGMGWHDPFNETWISPIHKELITLCDGNCPTHMDTDKFLKIQERCDVLEGQIRAYEAKEADKLEKKGK